MAGSRNAKDQLFEAFAAAGKALASGRRVEIVDLLAQGERSVEDIAGELSQTVANTSHHLRALAGAGLVRTRRDGTRIHYRLASDSVAELWSAVQRVATEHIAEIERLTEAYVGRRDELETVSRDELLRRMKRGEVTLIDVRPRPEYESGHIPGARWVSPAQLARALRSVPGDGEIVAYCRGSYCVYADQAVRALRRKGRAAKRLEDGFPEWRRAGLPVAVGDETR